jgi:hypothetical protein
VARFAVLLRYGGLAGLFGVLMLHADPGTVVVGLAAVVAGALLSRLVGAVPAGAVGTLSGPTLRALSASTATHPQRDPDAAGRPRPRAPSRGPLTA